MKCKIVCQVQIFKESLSTISCTKQLLARHYAVLYVPLSSLISQYVATECANYQIALLMNPVENTNQRNFRVSVVMTFNIRFEFFQKKLRLLRGLPDVQHIPETAIGNLPHFRSRSLSVAIISTLGCSFAA